MTTDVKPVTADELWAMGDIGRCELVYGELRMMSPAGLEHGVVAVRFGRYIGAFVDDNNLGVAFGAETGFRLEDDLVRAPDAGFVTTEHLQRVGITKKYSPSFPDLVVEVTSPDDRKREIAEKIDMWLAHGTSVVWLADPPSQTVTIYRTGKTAERIVHDGELRDEPLLPGFVLPLSTIFRIL